MCNSRLLVLSLFMVMLSGPGAGAVDEASTSGKPKGEAKPAGLDTDPHLVGWWRLDEISGNTAADASRHGRDGTLQGGLSFVDNSVPGQLGRALRLEGGDGIIEIVGFKAVTGTHPRTVAAWIKTKATRGEIISWGEDDAGKMWTYGFIRRHLGVTPSGGYLYINERIDDDQWHHVVAVISGGDPPNLHDDVVLYLDGEPAEIHDIGLLDVWPIDTGDNIDVRIGREFDGIIDDIRICDRGLDGDEVKFLFDTTGLRGS
jgi:hypothetical protein